MARLTVEDCIPFVGNRFDLVLLAAKRARQIALGSRALVPEEGDQPTVIALREIAAGLMSNQVLSVIEARETPVGEAAEYFAGTATNPFNV